MKKNDEKTQAYLTKCKSELKTIKEQYKVVNQSYQKIFKHKKMIKLMQSTSKMLLSGSIQIKDLIKLIKDYGNESFNTDDILEYKYL